MEIKFTLTVEDCDTISFMLSKMIKRSKVIDILAYGSVLIAWIWVVNLCLSNNSMKFAIIFSIVFFIIVSIYAFLSKESMQKKVTHIRHVRRLKRKKYQKYISEQKISLKKDTIIHTILNDKLEIKINAISEIITKENYIFIYSDTTKRLLYYDMSPKAPYIVIPRSVFSSLCEEKEFIKNITDNINRVKES